MVEKRFRFFSRQSIFTSVNLIARGHDTSSLGMAPRSILACGSGVVPVKVGLLARSDIQQAGSYS
jgi:hypothetical protein